MVKLPVIAIAAGDHAGIGPEITVKMFDDFSGDFIPVIVGDATLIKSEAAKYIPQILPLIENLADVNEAKSSGKIYLCDVPKKSAVEYGAVNVESGDHSFEQMKICCDLCKTGIADAFILAPVTKKTLNLSRPEFTSEMDFFCEEFNVKDIRPVVATDQIIRCSVVSHVRFRDIIDHITVDTVMDAGIDLHNVMKRSGNADGKIAMAAINPHGGDGGVFGDEEIVILAPAAEQLRKKGINIEGPFPADTVFTRAVKGQFSSVLFMFHDQGNIAGKLAQFGNSVVIYSKVPYPIVTTAHGSAADIAGKGLAKADNMKECLKWAVKMIAK